MLFKAGGAVAEKAGTKKKKVRNRQKQTNIFDPNYFLCGEVVTFFINLNAL